jgi:cholesterol 7-dehydrogenase
LKPVECLGRQLVIYRSEDGASVHATSAFCPHMGANLAGGRVRGQRIQCPFHKWEIGADGRIGHIPYSDELPAQVLHETFPIRELYGQVFIYHSSAERPSRFDEVPPYEIPRVPEMEDGRFVARGSYNAGRVRMHLIEFAENSADFAHFSNVHGRMALPWTSIKIPGIRIEHQADWQVDADNPHFALFSDRAVLHVLGRRIDRTQASAVITFVGPGGVVLFRFDVPDVGEIVMFQTHLPVGPLEQQVDFHWMADKKIPRLLVSYVIGNWVSQWREDIEIWENKVYLDRPYLAKGDGPVHRLRRWYSQFYPDRESRNQASIEERIENRVRTSAPSLGDSWSERPAAASPRASLEPPISAGS